MEKRKKVIVVRGAHVVPNDKGQIIDAGSPAKVLVHPEKDIEKDGDRDQ